MTKSGSVRHHLVLDEPDPRARGIARGSQLRADLTGSLELYFRLFHTVGVEEQRIREDALRLTETVAAWSACYTEEIDGIAEGAGIEPWHAMALNGRTEILANAAYTHPECSTLVRATGSPFGIQTWDWHTELDQYWHTQQVSGTRHAFAGITEHGILGKIGVNSAGLGLLFNILGHRDDTAAGVPVHVLAAAILGEAGSVAEALELLHHAPIGSSGALTLLGPDTAVCAEISPVGIASHQPHDGFLIHTNHFLDPDIAAREKSALYEPDSQDRLALITTRTRQRQPPTAVADLVEYLWSEPGEPLLCCVPKPGTEFGERWATLATVLLEPENRTVQVHAGSPRTASDGQWITLDATVTEVG